jgi:hypothetical protein
MSPQRLLVRLVATSSNLSPMNVEMRPMLYIGPLDSRRQFAGIDAISTSDPGVAVQFTAAPAQPQRRPAQPRPPRAWLGGAASPGRQGHGVSIFRNTCTRSGITAKSASPTRSPPPAQSTPKHWAAVRPRSYQVLNQPAPLQPPQHPRYLPGIHPHHPARPPLRGCRLWGSWRSRRAPAACGVSAGSRDPRSPPPVKAARLRSCVLCSVAATPQVPAFDNR